jgi:hypothetical protein
MFFVDLEFSNLQNRHDFYEICVADIHGTILLNTIIDHGESIQAISDTSSDRLHESIVKKIYGAPSDQ